MARDAGARMGQQLLGNRSSGNARGGLPRACAFEDVANVGASVLGDAGQVGVAGTWARDRRPPRASSLDREVVLFVRTLVGADTHRVLPVGPVAILDHHRDRAADRLAGADARKQLRAVGFDRHAAAASVAALSPPEVACNSLRIESQAGRNPFENHHERAPVRLAGGEKTHHLCVDCILIFCALPVGLSRISQQIPPLFSAAANLH